MGECMKRNVACCSILKHLNSAGKSTALSIFGGLISPTNGSVTFEGGVPRPPQGTIGIVPQKNVLFSELSCVQTLRVWRAVKWSHNSSGDEDVEQLLRDCDLEAKINSNAGTLSGGQKRKLQLAIGLVGGSKSKFIGSVVFISLPMWLLGSCSCR